MATCEAQARTIGVDITCAPTETPASQVTCTAWTAEWRPVRLRLEQWMLDKTCGSTEAPSGLAMTRIA